MNGMCTGPMTRLPCNAAATVRNQGNDALQDHYENLYVVVAGSKTFTLKPPSSVHQMHLQRYPLWQESMAPDQTFTARPVSPADTIEWSAVDLEGKREQANGAAPAAQCVKQAQQCGSGRGIASLRLRTTTFGFRTSSDDEDDCDQQRKFARFHAPPAPLQVTVRAGDMLYLPSMWYHHVTQDEGDQDAVIAVNWWFDMQFDGERFAMFNLLHRLSEQAGLIRGRQT